LVADSLEDSYSKIVQLNEILSSYDLKDRMEHIDIAMDSKKILAAKREVRETL
jgi:hypothetical protein